MTCCEPEARLKLELGLSRSRIRPLGRKDSSLRAVGCLLSSGRRRWQRLPRRGVRAERRARSPRPRVGSLCAVRCWSFGFFPPRGF